MAPHSRFPGMWLNLFIQSSGLNLWFGASKTAGSTAASAVRFSPKKAHLWRHHPEPKPSLNSLIFEDLVLAKARGPAPLMPCGSGTSMFRLLETRNANNQMPRLRTVANDWLFSLVREIA